MNSHVVEPYIVEFDIPENMSKSVGFLPSKLVIRLIPEMTNSCADTGFYIQQNDGL